MGAMDPPATDAVGLHSADDARPIHRVYVDGFWMDRTDVTNEEFARFVEATGYVTIAERTPTAADFPGAAPENLVAGSVVFSPPDHPVPLNDHYEWWSYVKGRGNRGGVTGLIHGEFHRCARSSQSREIGYPHRKKALESGGSRGEATMKTERGQWGVNH